MASPRRKESRQYTEAQATAWLAWLARGMRKRGQTVFLLEQLQPSWLATRRERWTYLVLSRTVWVAVAMGAFWVVLGLGMASIGFLDADPTVTVALLAVGGAGLIGVVGVVFGLALGLALGLMDLCRFEKKKALFRLVAVSGPLIVLGLVTLTGKPLNEALTLSLGFLMYLLPFALIWGVRGRKRNIENDIQTVEALTWSWAGFRKSLKKSWWWVLLLQYFYVIYRLFRAFLDGYQVDLLEMKTIPNEGVRLTARSAAIAGRRVVMAGVALGLLGAPIGALIDGLSGALIGFLVPAWVFAVVSTFAGVWFGGADVLQHYILRLILRLRGYAPFRLARFLDYAASELGFLQKVGGGYMFIHRYLLEHFADAEEGIEAGGGGQALDLDGYPATD